MDLHERSACSTKISPDFQLTRRGLIRFNRDSHRARRKQPQGAVLKSRSERQLRVSVDQLPMSSLLLFEGKSQTLQSSIYRHDKRFLDSDATLFFFRRTKSKSRGGESSYTRGLKQRESQDQPIISAPNRQKKILCSFEIDTNFS